MLEVQRLLTPTPHDWSGEEGLQSVVQPRGCGPMQMPPDTPWL
jgi:hypothetical protein